MINLGRPIPKSHTEKKPSLREATGSPNGGLWLLAGDAQPHHTSQVSGSARASNQAKADHVSSTFTAQVTHPVQETSGLTQAERVGNAARNQHRSPQLHQEAGELKRALSEPVNKPTGLLPELLGGRSHSAQLSGSVGAATGDQSRDK